MRTQFTSILTAERLEEVRVVDGFVTRITEHTGLTNTRSRRYTIRGMILQATDARGNVTTTETDAAGRPVRTIDAAGNATLTRYAEGLDLLACVTDALGHATCLTYDVRGRKTAQYGTGTQPLLFGYDDADHMISLTTFRAPEGDVSTDPTGRADGDTTRWRFDAATGLELRKNLRRRHESHQNLRCLQPPRPTHRDERRLRNSHLNLRRPRPTHGRHAPDRRARGHRHGGRGRLRPLTGGVCRSS